MIEIFQILFTYLLFYKMKNSYRVLQRQKKIKNGKYEKQLTITELHYSTKYIKKSSQIIS